MPLRELIPAFLLIFLLMIPGLSFAEPYCSHGNVTYSDCQLNYRHMDLWCDQTNYTRLPAPEDLRGTFAAPQEKASSFNGQHSCLGDIDNLNGFWWLQDIDLSYNRINALKHCTYCRGCSPGNSGYSLRANFSHNNISYIDQAAFSDCLEVLDLSHNPIETLPDLSTQYKRLAKLYVADTNIHTIPISHIGIPGLIIYLKPEAVTFVDDTNGATRVLDALDFCSNVTPTRTTVDNTSDHPLIGAKETEPSYSAYLVIPAHTDVRLSQQVCDNVVTASSEATHSDLSQTVQATTKVVSHNRRLLQIDLLSQILSLPIRSIGWLIEEAFDAPSH